MTAPDPAQPLHHVSAEELFREHARFVARFAARLGVRTNELDDVVQEVFLVAHRRGGYVEGPATATTWLAQIVLRVVRTRRRTERRRPPTLEEPDMETIRTGSSGPYELLATAQALGRMQQALDRIELEHRAVFILFELEEQPCDVIARSLGVPIGTVYSRLHAARRRFRQAYERLEQIEAGQSSVRLTGAS